MSFHNETSPATSISAASQIVHRAIPPELISILLLGPLLLFLMIIVFLYLGLTAFGMSLTLGMLVGAPLSGDCCQ